MGPWSAMGDHCAALTSLIYHPPDQKVSISISNAMGAVPDGQLLFVLRGPGERIFSEPGSGAKRKGNDTKVRACFFEF